MTETRWQKQTVKIKINADGVAGHSRDDLSVPQSITLYSVCGEYPATKYEWELLSKPSLSVAVLSTPTEANSGFELDVEGSYLIQLRVNDKVIARVIAAAKTANLGMRIPAKNETDEFSDGSDWPYLMEEVSKYVDDLSGGGGMVAHSFGGSYHNADTLAHVNAKISDADLVATTTSFGGDVTGHYDDIVVAKIQGKSVATTSPNNGEVLTWNSSSSKWEPSAAGMSAHNLGGAYHNADTLANLNAKVSDADLLATTTSFSGDVTGHYDDIVVAKIQGKSVATSAPSDGQVLVWNSSASKWSPQTQDAYMIQTRAISASAPNNGDVLVWDSGLEQWVPTAGGGGGMEAHAFGGVYHNADTFANFSSKISDATILTDGTSFGGDISSTYNAISVDKIKGNEISNSLPTDGYVLTWNESASLWTPQIQDAYQIQTRNVSSTAPSDGYVLAWNASVSKWTPQIQDAYMLQTRKLSSNAPNDGDVLAWNSATSQWKPTAGAGGGIDRFLIFSDNTEFSEAGGTLVTKKQFDVVVDEEYPNLTWVAIVKAKVTGGTGEAEVKIKMGSLDIITLTTSSSSYEILKGTVTGLADGFDFTAQIQLRVSSGVGVTAYIKYTDIYAVFTGDPRNPGEV